MYAAGSLLALALYGIDYYLGKMMNAEDGNDAEKSKETSESTTISELYTSLEGVYLIFLPFVPCLCWSLMLRYLAERQKSTTSQQQKEEEMKKNKWIVKGSRGIAIMKMCEETINLPTYVKVYTKWW